MSLILDLTQLVSGSKHIERQTLTVFEGVLKSCHELIKRYNKEQIKHIYYDVPSYVFGKPMYDCEVLMNYLIHHLTDNGLFVRRTDKAKELLISWDDKYINIDRFYQRQQQFKKDQNNIMMGMAAKPLSNIEALRLRQERQRQISLEREARFEHQKRF
jgi:hypothetical protein